MCRTGTGKISATGGNGFAGGGGGRISIDAFKRHDNTKIFIHGVLEFLSSICGFHSLFFL